MRLIHCHAQLCADDLLGMRDERAPGPCTLAPIHGRRRTVSPACRNGWTEEQPLDEVDDAFAVEGLSLALLDGEALLQGGAHQVVEQHGIGGRIKRRYLPLGHDVLE